MSDGNLILLVILAIVSIISIIMSHTKYVNKLVAWWKMPFIIFFLGIIVIPFYANFLRAQDEKVYQDEMAKQKNHTMAILGKINKDYICKNEDESIKEIFLTIDKRNNIVVENTINSNYRLDTYPL
jgi:uncharacterized membrane protein